LHKITKETRLQKKKNKKDTDQGGQKQEKVPLLKETPKKEREEEAQKQEQKQQQQEQGYWYGMGL